MNRLDSEMVGGCQPLAASLPSSPSAATLRLVESPEKKRQDAALEIFERVLREAGSYGKAANEIQTRTGASVSYEGLRKAIKAKRFGKHLLDVAERLSTAAPVRRAEPSSPERRVEYDDPYEHRPAALALLRGKIDNETINSLRLVSNKAEELSVDDWVREGKRLQRVRDSIGVADDDDDRAPNPDVSAEALASVAKRKR